MTQEPIEHTAQLPTAVGAVEQPWYKNVLLLFFLGIVAVIETFWILNSQGFYYIDEVSHYLYSRFVFQSLPATVETWHRPGRLWLFVLPAQMGHTFTMFFSLGLFLALLILTYAIAKLKGIKHAEWAVLLAGLQPILFDISYACLAEAPAALVLTLSYWFHLKERRTWAMILASAVFLFRFEMFAFAGFLFLLYAWKREWKALPYILLGPVMWIAYCAVISGHALTFFREWSRFSHIDKFIPGVPVTHYFANLHTVFGYAQLILFAAGAWFIARAGKSRDYLLLYCTIAANLVINTLAGADVFHWTASIGELRYVAVVGPLFAIVAVYGFSELTEFLNKEWLRTAFAVAVVGVTVFNCTINTHPRRWPNYDHVVLTMVRAFRADHPDKVLLSNSGIAAYALDVSPSGGKLYAKFNKKTLARYNECFVLWDPFSANSVFTQTEITKEAFLKDPSVTIADRYQYWKGEYLILHRSVKNKPAARKK